MISVQNLSKSFGTLQAIDRVTFTIEQGILCGLVGPNGAGKSTLFKLLMGMLEPDTGSIQIANETIHFGDTDYKNKIGFVPENPALYDYLTGSEFLAFITAAKKLPVANRQPEIQKWFDFFQLTAKSGELIKNYSHGMRRKISLCSALIGSPAILLLDEATNGLDPESSFKFKEYLKTYCQN
ncbi:MAG TPA: ABC transporter ATP-binding protein, partial [bacterium]